ncbi:MAG TPA: lipid-A-disaccharide synthase N-terminal domain-containing protein [Steroidobacteraceae bacterium]|jgi:lipid-A-disaccharide synthase-like uncharacterized protein
MNDVLLQIAPFGHPLTITGWKLVGYLGAAMFAGRWFVQVAVSHLHRHSHLPRLFWQMSLAGSVLLLSYFTFGKNDSVGIVSNFFPMLIAVYNLRMQGRGREEPSAAGAGAVGRG